MVKISVLMPAFNCEPYLDEAIRSIRNQTFRDFEFIIVNDGSTDGSLAVIQRHASEDGRIVVIDRPNSGIVNALNAGIDVCRGEFIARMDGDDLATPDRLAIQLSILENDSEVALLGSWTRIINEHGRVVGKYNPPCDHVGIDISLAFGCPIVHPTVVIRASVLEMAGPYTEGGAEDLRLWGVLSRRGYKLRNADRTLLNYRTHSENWHKIAANSHREATIEHVKCHLDWLCGGSESLKYDGFVRLVFPSSDFATSNDVADFSSVVNTICNVAFHRDPPLSKLIRRVLGRQVLAIWARVACNDPSPVAGRELWSACSTLMDAVPIAERLKYQFGYLRRTKIGYRRSKSCPS